jgi:hypothetical protein
MTSMDKRPAPFLLLPTPALASDPTPLFVIFVEAPLLFLSLIFLAVCFGAPKTGRVLAGLLLVASLFFLGWASRVGYMGSAGGMLLLSIFVDILGLIIAAKKIREAAADRPNEEQ